MEKSITHRNQSIPRSVTGAPVSSLLEISLNLATQKWILHILSLPPYTYRGSLKTLMISFSLSTHLIGHIWFCVMILFFFIFVNSFLKIFYTHTSFKSIFTHLYCSILHKNNGLNLLFISIRLLCLSGYSYSYKLNVIYKCIILLK